MAATLTPPRKQRSKTVFNSGGGRLTVRPGTKYEAVEQFLSTTPKAGQVDREKGIIYGVKVCGLESANPAKRIGIRGPAGELTYRYQPRALQESLDLYDGVVVNCDHAEFKLDEHGKRTTLRGRRKMVDRFGIIRDPRMEEDGIYADLWYNREHPLAGMVTEAAERMPQTLALSHDVTFVPEIIGGRCEIVEIEEVRSVDIIGEKPGTTNGLFESAGDSIDFHDPELGSIDGRSVAREALESAFRDLKLAAVDFGGAAVIAQIEALESTIMADNAASAAETNAADAPAPAATETITPPASEPAPAADAGGTPAESPPAEKPADAPAGGGAAVESAAPDAAPKGVEATESTISGMEASRYLMDSCESLVGYLPNELQTPFRQNLRALCESFYAQQQMAAVVAETANQAASVESAVPADKPGQTNAQESAVPATEPAKVEPAKEVAPPAATVAAAVSATVEGTEAATPAATPAAGKPGAVAATEATEAAQVAIPKTVFEAFESAEVPISLELAGLYMDAGNEKVRAELLAGWKAKQAKPGVRVPAARSAPPKPAMHAAESHVPDTKAVEEKPLGVREILSKHRVA